MRAIVTPADRWRLQRSSLPVPGRRSHTGGTCAPAGCRQRRAGPARIRRGCDGAIVRAGGIESDHAEQDQAERGELERAGRLAVGEDADQRDRGGADGRPDGVRGADGEVLEHQREQPERDHVADDDDRRG